MRLFGRFNDSDAERLRLSAQITELLAQARASAELPSAYDPEDKFTWREGDIEIKWEGTGPPLISQQELDRMLAENKLPDRFYAEEPIDVELPDGTKVKWAEYIAQEEAKRRKAADSKRRIKTIHVQDPDGYLVMVAHDLGERPPLHDLVTRAARPGDLPDL